MQTSLNATSKSLADRTIEMMHGQIQKYGLELLQHYPKDIQYDQATLEWAAKPGAQIAWMCGHTHTHLVVLGLNNEENLNVTYLTNLASEDRFYLIKVAEEGMNTRFTMKEVKRDEFALLHTTRVPYSREGGCRNFCLVRGGFRVGHVALSDAGSAANRWVRVTVTPSAGLTDLDRSALIVWGSRAVTEASGSLFTQMEMVWAEEVCLHLVA